MSLRLRQIALVAAELAPVEQLLAELFGLRACHRDPAVAEFGLENVLFPIGNQFLEIVAPTRSGTAAGRYLERRRGDGGYMVITQCADHAAYRARVEQLGVRIAHEFKAEGFRNMQLHPRDTGGSFFEIDQQLGSGAEQEDGPWTPAGPDWRDFRSTECITAIAAAEIQADAPATTAERWRAIADGSFDPRTETPTLLLGNATLRFVPCRDGRPEGLAGLDLACADRSRVRSNANRLGLTVNDATILAAGMRWRLV